MKKISYSGYRFPPEIIHQAIWLYFRFTLSFRDVEDLLAERGIAVSYETIRRWVNHFGPMIALGWTKQRPWSRRQGWSPCCGTSPGTTRAI
jgi:transposase-like protein